MSDTNAIVPAERAQALGKAIEYGEGGVVVRTVEDLKNLAKWSVESGFLPEQVRTPQQAFVIMVSGAELGLKPMAAVKFLYLTKGRRVALMTKGALAVVQAKPTYDGYREWIENEGLPSMTAVAWAKRKGQEGQTKTFSIADAEAAGLLKDKGYTSTYQAYLKDMLLSRARGRVLDIVFAAELGGIPIEGIAEDADMMDARRNGPREIHAAPPAGRRDPLLDELSGASQTTDRPIEAPEFIDAEAVTVIESGPPPAAQPDTGKPKAVVGSVKARAKATEDKRKAEASAAGPAPGGGCSRCKGPLNAMLGCDVCGWPGADIR